MAETETSGFVGRLHWSDILVIVLYFLFVIVVGLWAAKKSKRDSLGGYFLASRSMHFTLVGASLFASNIGSGHFIGLAGSGAANGIGVAVFELNAIFVLMMLGWLFIPVYIAAGVFTMPEYLRKRFGGQRIRVYLSVLALLLYVFTKISADLYAGAIFIEQSLHWNLYASTAILLLIAALFTITGGLTAVIWTDTLQTIIMIVGAFALMILAFVEVGGYENAISLYFNSIANSTVYSGSTCGMPPANSMHMIRSATDGDYPWPGMFFGLTISSVWYWCSDQVIVQRVLAAKNLSHAKAGCIFAGYLKILPLFLLVFPGMIARIIFPDDVGCSDPDYCEELCGSRSSCSNIAYPRLVLHLMPNAARGLMMAVMMSALMSSLTSIFNSSSTIFTVDVWTRMRKNASEMEQLIVGRLFVIVLVVVGILWIPVIQASKGSQLFVYIQSITSYLAPPVCAVYVLAIFWKRTNEPGAFWGLMAGLVVGLIRFAWEFSYTSPDCGAPDLRPAIITKMHYLHFGILLFGISVIVTVIVSLLTKPIPEEHLYRLTFWSRKSEKERIDISEAEDANELELKDTYNSTDRTNGSHTPVVRQPSYKRLPWWKKLINFVCGIKTDEERALEPVLTQAQIAEQEKQGNSIYEERKARLANNINAVILMAAAVFLWGFYA
ncbi:PREDICTED: sodium/glucose cotransporter 4-like [Priapulus caudatus]|uniref:Sodium/glucose cotransporter 4-like n=1 Tax=Priapulus caudatus TaxID=37621 RepID=A0ABM1DUG9_PRICU|nr:PREDICTED: sodium/glucose cotransporter 4-like [Priapulus caudatus]